MINSKLTVDTDLFTQPGPITQNLVDKFTDLSGPGNGNGGYGKPKEKLTFPVTKNESIKWQIHKRQSNESKYKVEFVKIVKKNNSPHNFFNSNELPPNPAGNIIQETIINGNRDDLYFYEIKFSITEVSSGQKKKYPLDPILKMQ